MGSRKRRKHNIEIDYSKLLDAKVINAILSQLRQSEMVTAKITGKKKKRHLRESVKFKAAVTNLKKAVTRRKLADTLLRKHHKSLTKYIQKYE